MNTQSDSADSPNGETISHNPKPAMDNAEAPTYTVSNSNSLTDAGSLGHADNATVAYRSASREDAGDAGTMDFSLSDKAEQVGNAVSEEFFRPKQMGDYLIERVLGQGAMGIVYRARQTKLGRVVALKMIRAGAHASSEFLSRFEAEAKAVAHLQHPNIVQIFEIGEHEKLPYFSLEFVDGSSLDRELARNPMTSQAAAQLTITLCGAMQYAHDHGVLHRDLKPANVLISKEGLAKVTDFGLAKLTEDGDASSSTQTGTIMGTPSYMSPEQALGQVHELGPATDQYSLGQCCTSFSQGGHHSRLQAHLKQ